MLVIRKEQLAALGAYARRGFEKTLALHLRETLPEQVEAISDEQLHAFVAQAIDRAASHGVRSEADVVLFAELLLRRGENFDTQSPAQPIFARASMPGGVKMSMLRRALAAVNELGTPA